MSHGFKYLLGNGVTVAQQTLTLFVLVRIQVPQPAAPAALIACVCYFTPRAGPRFRDINCPDFANALSLRDQRAQGKPGADCTRSLVCSKKSTRVSHHRFNRS